MLKGIKRYNNLRTVRFHLMYAAPIIQNNELLSLFESDSSQTVKANQLDIYYLTITQNL